MIKMIFKKWILKWKVLAKNILNIDLNKIYRQLIINKLIKIKNI
jgi:hypothetical protein